MTTLPTYVLRAVANNADPQLLADIGAGDTAIALKVGHGAELPTILRSTATSGGTAILLNCTGIQAMGVAVGDFIENYTDGSVAVITSVSTNSIGTTPLQNGSDNLWENSDGWRIGAFVLTLTALTVDGAISKQERVLCTVHTVASDNITVTRSFGSDSAQTFSANDYAWLSVEKTAIEEIQKGLRWMIQQEYVDNVAIAANRVIAQKSAEQQVGSVSGTNTVTGSLSPAITTYAAGLTVRLVVANSCTGAVTLNLNSIGATAVKRLDGATALVSGDWKAGQTVTLTHDGTYWQMVSPSGNSISSPWTDILNTQTVSTDTINSTTATVAISNSQVTITGNTVAAGDTYEYYYRGYSSHVNGSSLVFQMNYGGVQATSDNLNSNSGSPTQGVWEVMGYFQFFVIGASGTMGWQEVMTLGKAGTVSLRWQYSNQAPASIDTTADMLIKLTCQTDSNNAGNYCRCQKAHVRKMT